jgi:hypothetical protein
MEEPQQSSDGKTTTRARLHRLAERLLLHRGIGPGAPSPIDEQGTMPVPPPSSDTPLHRGAEACQQEPQEGAGEFRAGLAIGRRAAPYA